MANTNLQSIEEWVAREAFSFDVDSPEQMNVAVDRIVASIDDGVELLGLGEPTHMVEAFLVLRNRVFERLVERHGFTAIAIESSFPRGTIADAFLAGKGAARTFDDVAETGFSHGFGRMSANRSLIEWMRAYNADPSHARKLNFYGFDSPTEMTGTDSPRQLLMFALDYLDSMGAGSSNEARRKRIDELLGDDAPWTNPAAMWEHSKSIGLSPAAAALRVETEGLISELELQRPELANRPDDDGGDGGRFLEALQHAVGARRLLTYHAALARPGDTSRLVEGLGIRDATMADNLVYAVERERRRGGKVFAFAQNTHLQRGQAKWQLGPHALAWWPAGAHVDAMLGSRYAVIGVGVGTSPAMGVSAPEAGTIEARLSRAGQATFAPTHRAGNLAASELAGLSVRTANPSYFPFTAASIRDLDGLIVLSSP